MDVDYGVCEFERELGIDDITKVLDRVNRDKFRSKFDIIRTGHCWRIEYDEVQWVMFWSMSRKRFSVCNKDSGDLQCYVRSWFLDMIVKEFVGVMSDGSNLDFCKEYSTFRSFVDSRVCRLPFGMSRLYLYLLRLTMPGDWKFLW